MTDNIPTDEEVINDIFTDLTKLDKYIMWMRTDLSAKLNKGDTSSYSSSPYANGMIDGFELILLKVMNNLRYVNRNE